MFTIPEKSVTIRGIQTIAELMAINNSAQGGNPNVAVHGVIHNVRDMGGFAFIILRKSDGLLQCVYDKQSLEEDRLLLKTENAVTIQGTLREEARAINGIEVVIEEIRLISAPAAETPIDLGKRHLNIALENEINIRPITLRNARQRSIFKLQEGIVRGIRRFLEDQQFTEIFSPKIVASGAEGGANIFKLDYFEKKAYLAQSPQFYKQIMIPVYERVFEIGPVFRAEKHNTVRHLSEYTSIDFEMGFIDSFYDVIDMETKMLSAMFRFLETHYAPVLRTLAIELPDTDKIPRLRFKEAKEAVAKKYNRKIKDPYDLEPEEERLVSQLVKEEYDSDFVFVTHYPVKKRPFYAMDDPEDPKYTLSFDLLFRGLEITTGGQRIHDYELQVEKMKTKGLDPQDFEHYLMLHKYGCPPHGGLGLGLERLLLQLCAEKNIRAVTMFPRDTNRLTP